MNQTALVLTTTKRNYLIKACLASLFGGQKLDQSYWYYILQTILQVVSVIQTYVIAKLVDNYAIVLIIPAAINVVLQIFYNCIISKELKKSRSELTKLITALIPQTLGTASAMKYEGNILDAIVFFFLFPREQNIEIGFTEQESYCRSRYACLFLKLILILTHVDRMLVANIIRYIYYFTPIMIWIGLYGQFSQFAEYVIEQFNFFMGSSYSYSKKRTYLNLILNVILIAICLALSFINEPKIALIISGCIINIKIFNIFGNVNDEPKQLYKSSYFTRKQIQIDVVQLLMNIIPIILCGIFARSYYRELYYAIIPIYILFWLSLYKQEIATQWFKLIICSIQCACISMMDYDFEGAFSHRLFSCTTIVRLFSLSHVNPNYLFFEQLVCFIISFRTDYSMLYCQYIGFLVQFAIRAIIRINSRISIWIIANQKMLTVKKQKVNGATIITSLQVCLCPLTFIIMVISSLLDAPYMPFLGLPLYYFSSLRPFRNTIQINKHIEGSSEASIYNALLSQSYFQLLQPFPIWSHYLIRIGKYIGIIQLLECYSGYAIIQFKGLESQETTSCHGIEAREVDRLVDAKEWSSCCGSALTLQRKFNVNTYEENQIVLTGIIEAQEFVSGFKKIYLKMLSYYSQELNESHQKSIIKLSKEFEGDDCYFPFEFAESIKLSSKFDFTATEIIDEKTIKSPTKVVPVKIQIQHDEDDIFGMLNDLDQIPKLQKQQIKTSHQANSQHKINTFYNYLQKSILYLYQISLSDLNFNFDMRLNQKQLFDLFQNSKMLSEKRQMNGIELIFSEIVTKAIRSALKLSVDIYSVEGHLQIDDTQLFEEMKSLNDCYVGMGNDEGWQSAMQSKLQLWSLGYETGQNKLTIYRQNQNDIECQLFRFNTEVIRGIEANLQMELLFATNDDEERYSIQTHEQFFRNMIIEGSELPLGYAPFYSGPVAISLR